MSKIWLAAPADPGSLSPSRAPNSIRRTSTIDTQWPDGRDGNTRVRARARDLFTDADGQPHVLSEDWVRITAFQQREIVAIETSRHNDVAQKLVGAKGGGYLRKALLEILPDEVERATPLNLLLDDFSGASLVAAWIWPCWSEEWTRNFALQDMAAIKARMEGICTGHAPGASSIANLDAAVRGEPLMQPSRARVPAFPSVEDPIGWHEIEHQEGVGVRRARRMDVRVEGDVLHLDIGFQDSGTAPDGGDRFCVHEYRVLATADPVTLELLSLDPDPRILPYRECPNAMEMAQRAVGSELRKMRTLIPTLLPGILGCTHLNDVMRSMSDVPALARKLTA